MSDPAEPVALRRQTGPRRDGLGPEIDLRATFLTLWRGLWVIVLCALLSGAAGLLSVSHQPPSYRAQAKVLFDAPRPTFEGLDAVVTTPTARNGLTNQIEILRSTALIERVIAELDLGTHPQLRAEMLETRSLGEYVQALAHSLGIWTPPGAIASGHSGPEEQADALVTHVRAGLSLRPIKNSDVIVIGYSASDPQLAARIANAVAEQYIVDQLAGKLDTFRQATQWLAGRVQELQSRVERSETAVLTARADVARAAGMSLEATRDQIIALTRDLAAARRHSGQLRAAHARLEGALKVGADLATLSQMGERDTISGLRTREASLMAEDRTLAASLDRTHPSRLRIQEELTAIRADLQAEAQQMLTTLRLDLEAAQALESQVAADLRAAEAQNLKLAEQSVDIRNLEREAQASRILYENLLARLEETDAQEDLQGADARILTPARPPQLPVSTARDRILLGTIILGGLLGAALVLLLDAMHRAFRTAGEVEDTLDSPVLATIPRLGRRRSLAQMVSHLSKKPNSSLAEAIRNLRTSVLFPDRTHPPKVVMFSSSVPGEGKTTTAVLTAMTCQQMGRTAIIVDCDLRKAALADLVGARKPGLLALLEGRSTLDQSVHRDPETGLHMLTAGTGGLPSRINAADALASKSFKALIDDLSQRYDLVVLDTPPTLVFTDARIVAGLADAVVFAVRWDKTPRGAVQEGLHELTVLKAPVIGIALTMVNEQRAARFSYGGRSFYKGRYRGYYHA